MAIVDVELPSGYTYSDHRVTLGDDTIERTDVRGSNAIFYFNEVRKLKGFPHNNYMYALYIA